jgi:hypothetical protein
LRRKSEWRFCDSAWRARREAVIVVKVVRRFVGEINWDDGEIGAVFSVVVREG